ncbi:MAG: hypothetical protein ICV83_25200 [Cytophagales bacterium]|nr:hypothetical protein [Cytophagales bacterium]
MKTKAAPAIDVACAEPPDRFGQIHSKINAGLEMAVFQIITPGPFAPLAAGFVILGFDSFYLAVTRNPVAETVVY